MEKNIYIRPVADDELPACLEVIHRSFATVAGEFGITRENFPRFTGFMPLSFLQTQARWGWHMLGLSDGGRLVGYISLSDEGGGVFELHNLAVLPEYRHCGYGKALLDKCKETARELTSGGLTTIIKIGIIEENTRLAGWYAAHGFIHTGNRKFSNQPTTAGFMEWRTTQ